MHAVSKAAENYHHINQELQVQAEKSGLSKAQLIVVSKTFDADVISPVIEAGARVFGENRIQEAQGKWPYLKSMSSDINLHLIGPLQSNKTADAVALFDCIQTIDREKIANAVANEMKKQNKKLKLFVQVNTGSEPQKAGVLPAVAKEFVNWCQSDIGIQIEGLMCIPPFDENPDPHFKLLKNLAQDLSLKSLSMGMSSDYLQAVAIGATHVRVGSSIFGTR